MDRPKIICHILQSVDGNIDGGVRLSSAFDDSPLAAGHAPVALKLTYLQRLEEDALWLRYAPTQRHLYP